MNIQLKHLLALVWKGFEENIWNQNHCRYFDTRTFLAIYHNRYAHSQVIRTNVKFRENTFFVHFVAAFKVVNLKIIMPSKSSVCIDMRMHIPTVKYVYRISPLFVDNNILLSDKNHFNFYGLCKLLRFEH